MPPDEPAAATETTSATPEQRMQSAIEKGKALTGVAEAAESEEPNGAKPEAAQQPAGAQASDDGGEGTSVAEAPDGAKPAPAEEPKTKRAKEWADIERKKADLSRRERETTRREEAITKQLADFTKVQERYAELERMRREDPKAFVEQFGQGGVRALFEAAVAQEKRTPEEEERATLKKKLEELEDWKRRREESEAKAKEEWERNETQRQERARHQQNYKIVHESISELAKGGGYPNVSDVLKHKRASDYVTTDVYNRILESWKDGSGVQRPISDVLDDVERELAAEAGSVPQPEPPARTNGAVQPAKSEARPKRTPPTLTSAQASARASSGRELKGEERLKYAASMLRTRPE